MMDFELLSRRAEIIRNVRNFFDSRNYLETDTPLLAPDLIPESCLEVFETARLAPPGSRKEKQPYWLIPSPEIWMKKIIAAHHKSIYQICKCFRNGESSGRMHSPEFTMLEYYTMDADYQDSLKITEELFAAVGSGSSLLTNIECITMEEAFTRWAGFNLYDAAGGKGSSTKESSAKGSALEKEARRLGLDPLPGLDTAALYDLIFIHAVEPMLPKDHPVALIDYPAFVPCLSKKSSDGRTVERWELYVRGVELANCYSEETDPVEVQKFFESETKAKKESSLVQHKVDTDYWKVFNNFPKCSGVALGLDRLIMILAERSTIDGVLPFPMS
ncbi:elongation factor P--(R)-beta-lysine ligase [Spirochaetia bacterium]|nr:elongation factor P--(R)-beta-lysine ligase [Spirochaetia bacterium]